MRFYTVIKILHVSMTVYEFFNCDDLNTILLGRLDKLIMHLHFTRHLASNSNNW